MATSVRSAAALRRLVPAIPPASTGHARGQASFGTRTWSDGARGLSMVVAGSTRRRAREGGDGDGVLGAPIVGGPGAELGDQLSVVMKFGGVLGVVGREDGGGCRPHPGVPRGAPRRRPLCHGENHQPPAPRTDRISLLLIDSTLGFSCAIFLCFAKSYVPFASVIHWFNASRRIFNHLT